jgi:phosphoribosylanthranilate isomerase
MTRVKVCGVTRLEDARRAVELGAAALGFNFYPPSPRYLAPAHARDIICRLPPFIVSVGVFADELNDQHIATVAREAAVTAVQLHGVEIPALKGPLGAFTIIRALQVRNGFKAADLHLEEATAFLLDAYDPSLHGGTGNTFDWSLAREAACRAPIILAGGLTPENVGRAIHEARPYAVDVATGVEVSPGVKDARKMGAFFAAVAEADRAYGEGLPEP